MACLRHCIFLTLLTGPQVAPSQRPQHIVVTSVFVLSDTREAFEGARPRLSLIRLYASDGTVLGL